MIRSLIRLMPVVALAALARAQCLQSVGGAPVTFSPHTLAPANDEGRSAPLPIGFAFPMTGASSPSYTHAVIESNGAIYLTNGGPATGLAGSFTYGSLQNLQGPPGSSPRIAAFWTDLVPGPTWAATINTSVPGLCTIEWLDVLHFGTGQTTSIQLRLRQNGQIEFVYRALTTSPQTIGVGVSVGNGAANPGPSNLSDPASSTGGLIYQIFLAGDFDLSGNTLRFVPNGSGYNSSVVCSTPIAEHTSYGRGCYDIARDSFYQVFGTPAAASAALNGQSMTLQPVANGYFASWGGGTFVPPGASAQSLLVLDDFTVDVTPSVPMPYPGGSSSVLRVNANGVVSTGVVVLRPNTYTPNATGLLSHTPASWFSWHDYNLAQGGTVWSEEVANVLYLTWDNAESYAVPEQSNPSTMQFQFELLTGIVRMVWVAITPIGTGLQTQFPEQHLIGWSPGGPSFDPGPIALASQLPVVTQPDVASLRLTAAPLAISGPSGGSTITFTTANMPEALPGTYVGMLALSLNQLPSPGIDLAFLGAPGCPALVGSGTSLGLLGSTPTVTSSLTIPAGLPIGAQFFSQAAALFPPNSLPNGQNAFGLLTSNGLVTTIAPL